MTAFHLHPFRTGRARGQELVEFALIIPILMLFVYGVIDFARLFQALIVINNAAREGARYGVQYGLQLEQVNSGTDYYIFRDKDINGVTDIEDVTKAEALSKGINLSSATVTVSCPGSSAPAGCYPYDRLRVIVSYPFNMLFQKILSWNMPALFTLNRSAEMEVP